MHTLPIHSHTHMNMQNTRIHITYTYIGKRKKNKKERKRKKILKGYTAITIEITPESQAVNLIFLKGD